MLFYVLPHRGILMIYKTKVFQSACKKLSIKDTVLITACEEMQAGLVDAHLGDALYKKRIAMPGQGKRGSYRTMIGAVLGDRYFFLYVFSKSDKSNVNAQELEALKFLSRQYLSFSQHAIDKLVVVGELTKVEKDHE